MDRTTAWRSATDSAVNKTPGRAAAFGVRGGCLSRGPWTASRWLDAASPPAGVPAASRPAGESQRVLLASLEAFLITGKPVIVASAS